MKNLTAIYIVAGFTLGATLGGFVLVLQAIVDKLL